LEHAGLGCHHPMPWPTLGSRFVCGPVHERMSIGVRDGVLLASVRTAGRRPREPRVASLIARQAGVSPSMVTIVSGERARDKLIRVDGVDQVALNDALTQQKAKGSRGAIVCAAATGQRRRDRDRGRSARSRPSRARVA